MTETPLSADLMPIDLMIESTGGGSARHVMDLFDALRARGRDVRLVVSTQRSEAGFLDWLDGVEPGRVLRLDLRRAPHPSDLRAALRLRRVLRSGAAKGGGGKRLLHAHSTKAGFIGALASRLYAGALFTPHAYRGMDPTLGAAQRRALRMVEYAISRPYGRILAVSPEERDYALDIGLDPARLRYVPNGIDIAAIAAAAGAPRPRAGGPVVGFGSRMTYQKNPLTFLEAFSLVHAARPDVRAVMIGAGDMDREVNARIDALGLGAVVTRLGHAPLVAHLQDMDVMVHSSHYESLPYVLLEACAVGLPVVSVRNAGSDAIFGANADLVADSRDAVGIAGRVLALLASPEAEAAARARARAVGRRFSIEGMVDAVAALYDEIGRDPGRRDRPAAGGPTRSAPLRARRRAP